MNFFKLNENYFTFVETAEEFILNVEDMFNDEIDVVVLADGEVDDTVDVDMKGDNEGEVADDDKNVEEVETLENFVTVEEGA